MRGRFASALGLPVLALLAQLALLAAPTRAFASIGNMVDASLSTGTYMGLSAAEYWKWGLRVQTTALVRSRWSPWISLDIAMSSFSRVNPGAASSTGDPTLEETRQGSVPMWVILGAKSPIRFGGERGRVGFGLSWLYLDASASAAGAIPNALTILAAYDQPLSQKTTWQNSVTFLLNPLGTFALALAAETGVRYLPFRWGGPVASLRMTWIRSIGEGGAGVMQPTFWLGMNIGI